ncbi:MAG: hypothetical protein O7E52_14745 [Candidatus Poribacteria bacterium]|nr:hypothetical protein [Candidatus Poribacteria bacterium]
MRITAVEISTTVIDKLEFKHHVTEDEVRQVLLYDEQLIVYRTGRGKRRQRNKKQERRYLTTFSLSPDLKIGLIAQVH